MTALAQMFAEQMRHRRQEAQLSQEALGDRLELDRTVISRIERTRPNLTIARAGAIANALGTNLSLMLDGTSGFHQAFEQSTQVSIQDITSGFQSCIKARRELAGLSQRELGARLGVDRNWVSAVESGSGNVTLSTLERFARALDCKPTELLMPQITASTNRLVP